jgi:transposase
MTDEKPFEQLVKTEQSASSFLRRRCWENYQRFCVRCHSYRFYRIAGKKYRCRRCGYTFHDFSGRWLTKCRISSREWLTIIHLFESELPARQISERVGLSYPTVLKALEILRYAIIANSSDAQYWLEYVHASPKESEPETMVQKMVTVFGISEQHGNVRIKVLKGLPSQTVAELKSKMLRRSSIFYTDEYHPYEALVFHEQGNGCRWIKGLDSNKIYKADGTSDFWRYAKTKISKHRGISREKFPQYLKELEFRYNHRNDQIFYILCQYLVSFIPSIEDGPILTKPVK